MSNSDWPISIHEIRRRAPLHYWAKAVNAHFAAYVLEHSAQRAAQARDEIHYGGSPGIALGEAYWREAALALELITKAVIARRIEVNRAPANLRSVPMTHDVVRLWGMAQLPSLSLKDQERLLFVKRLLFWAGRYAAPRTDEAAAREDEEERSIIERQRSGDGLLFRIRKMEDLLAWSDFDRLFRLALADFDKLEM